MFQLINLQWKSFFRSASIAGNLFSKIIMFFGIIYVTLMSFLLGIIHGWGISLTNPEAEKIANPFLWINKEIIYIIGYSIVIRYLFQKIPILNIRSLLLTPLKKTKIIRYAMHQTIFSIFNLALIIYLLIFSAFVNLETDSGNLFLWNVSIILIIYITNFLNILLNKKDKLVFVLFILLTVLKILEFNLIVDLSVYSKMIFYSFYETPILVFVPLLLLVYTYYNVHTFFKKNITIDTGLSIKVKEGKMNNFDWLNRFGSAAIFLKNDIRLITRAKRARSTTIMGTLYVLNGFIFMAFADVYGEMGEFFGLFISTAGFMFTFCGMVPSWDSKHYPLMMCQNITYLDYLKSKWYLGIIGTILTTILALIIYSYFGLYYIIILACCSLYNLGINSYMTLWSGAFNRTAIDLESNKNAFGDKKAFNSKTLLLIIPQMVLPMLVFYFVSEGYDKYVAAYCIGIIGIIGIFLRNIFFKIILNTYKSQKYSALSAYKQTN
ncbi:DUF5687 family protein [Flavobacteriales bacterium]|nr:DUF5687 family protein [Flavobacteriales bacterium]